MISKIIRIFCVDDHAFLVEGLASRLSLEPDLEFVGRLATADHLTEEVQRARANVVLLDIEMPGADPFEALRQLSEQCPDVRTIIFSAYVRDHLIDTAIKNGAWGYVSKGDEAGTVIEAIRSVTSGEFAFGPTVLERCQKLPTAAAPGTAPSSKLQRLTERERDILRLIGKGLSRIQIAEALHRSPKTIDNHRAAIMEKLAIHDRVELARFAIREGLTDL